MRVFVDTNVFVYLFDRDAADKRQRARTLLQGSHEDAQFAISTQVLQEFYVVVTHKLARPLAADVAARVVGDLARLPVQQVTADLVMAAISRTRHDGFSFWDALIVEAALRSGAEQLWSEDMQDRHVIEGMAIRNPFR
jgi:predicted nucleic acid-binding protein